MFVDHGDVVRLVVELESQRAGAVGERDDALLDNVMPVEHHLLGSPGPLRIEAAVREVGVDVDVLDLRGEAVAFAGTPIGIAVLRPIEAQPHLGDQAGPADQLHLLAPRRVEVEGRKGAGPSRFNSGLAVQEAYWRLVGVRGQRFRQAL